MNRGVGSPTLVKDEDMNAITEATRVVRNDAIPAGEIDGELVALDIDRGECFGMDRVGSTIWTIAAEPVTVGGIADQLTRNHDVSRDRCLSDILPFIEELVAEGLLRKVSE